MLLNYFSAFSFLLSNNNLDFVEIKRHFSAVWFEKVFLVCPRETLKKIKVFFSKHRSRDFLLVEVILLRKGFIYFVSSKKFFFLFLSTILLDTFFFSLELFLIKTPNQNAS